MFNLAEDADITHRTFVLHVYRIRKYGVMKKFAQIWEENSQFIVLTYSLKACPDRITHEAKKIPLKTGEMGKVRGARNSGVSSKRSYRD